MDVKELIDILVRVPPDTKIVGEQCFKQYHGLQLAYAGLGHEGKFVLFFKDKKIAKA